MNDFTIGFLLITFSISIIYFHECGHYIAAKRYGKNPQFKWRIIKNIKIWPIAVSYEFDPNIVTKQKQNMVTLSGMLFGLIPILTIVYLFYYANDYYFVYVTILAYIGMCGKDILRLLNIDYSKYEVKTKNKIMNR